MEHTILQTVHCARGGASSPDGVWHTWVHLDCPSWTPESKGAERITWALQSCKKLQDRRKEELVKVPVDKYNYYYISTCRLVNVPVDKDGSE